MPLAYLEGYCRNSASSIQSNNWAECQIMDNMNMIPIQLLLSLNTTAFKRRIGAKKFDGQFECD
jgi:hypothetical protein